ncbi:MAG: LD-carboxypeptidase [Candidatus Korobacteraceae bacterium]|jgi:muramoyltetrapeptide carboxypeptidase
MDPATHTQFIRPQALRQGDMVGVIAPCSPVEREALEAGCARLRELGYRPLYLPSILESDLYFAGSIERRAGELHQMFARPEVRAIVCARGGYGCNYLLPHLDADLVRAHPKIFVGYSDLTWLLSWLNRLGHVAFHGPMAARGFAKEDGVHLDSWRAVLGGEPCSLGFGAESPVKPLVEGSASGILSGGCLSILTASLGTPYELETAGRVLFLEDVAAKPYQIDRMLMQLKMAGKLAGVRAIIFGEMLDCVQPGGQDYSLQEIVARIVEDLGVPVAYGLSSGHVARQNVTLPFGVPVELSVGQQTVELHLESAAIPVEKQGARTSLPASPGRP